MERGEGRFSAIQRQPDRPQLFSAVAGPVAKHHTEHRIGRGGGDHQHPGIYIGIENAVDHGICAGQKSQGQHTARKPAGHRKKQQRQPQKTPLSAKGRQCQSHARRQLHRQGAEKAAPGKEYRSGIGASQRRRQKQPPPAGRDAGQPGGAPQKQIVHQTVEQEHTVHIHHRHRRHLLVSLGPIIYGSMRKRGRKKAAVR